MIKTQVVKCTTSGFITNLGGLIALPIAIPADLTACIFVQLQMIATVAVIGGYDPSDDEVRTLAFMCLIGESVAEVINRVGGKVSNKLGNKLIEKVPGKVLQKINGKMGGRIFTKFGTTGIVNLVDLIPVLGGVVGWYKLFYY